MNTGAAQTTLAADTGGTHMRAALISQHGAILLRRVLPSLIRSVAAHAATGKAAASHAVAGLPGLAGLSGQPAAAGTPDVARGSS